MFSYGKLRNTGFVDCFDPKNIYKKITEVTDVNFIQLPLKKMELFLQRD